MRLFLVFFSVSLSFLGLVSCQSRPVRELAIADVALKAAHRNKADALAPDAYRQAENYFLRAKKDFSDGYYDSSRKFASQARVLAEKAEFLSLAKQSQIKDKSLESSDDTRGRSAPFGLGKAPSSDADEDPAPQYGGSEGDNYGNE